jgi:hypothetical protein
MVHGIKTTQNAIENIAADGIVLQTLFGTDPSAFGQLSIITPIAAANRPLSGRNKTATPQTMPVKAQSHRDAREVLNANVVVKHARTAKKLVGTSVKIVAT